MTNLIASLALVLGSLGVTGGSGSPTRALAHMVIEYEMELRL